MTAGYDPDPEDDGPDEAPAGDPNREVDGGVRFPCPYCAVRQNWKLEVRPGVVDVRGCGTCRRPVMIRVVGTWDRVEVTSTPLEEP